jgi:uncharacterized membrane protein YeaQ/YmgE (transglycosylase-associated protein family)
MGLIAAGAVAGVLGTLAMDLLNNLVARTGIFLKIDVGMIGRMAVGWTRGRFRYGHPGEMEQVAYEGLYGYVTHYLIGVGLAVPYVLGWDLLVGGPASPTWALVYGVTTTAASYFVVYPSIGLGAFGRRSPEGIRAILSPLANHLFYGLGLAVGVALM